jgi:hypothetical protein
MTAPPPEQTTLEEADRPRFRPGDFQGQGTGDYIRSGSSQPPHHPHPNPSGRRTPDPNSLRYSGCTVGVRISKDDREWSRANRVDLGPLLRDAIARERATESVDAARSAVRVLRGQVSAAEAKLRKAEKDARRGVEKDRALASLRISFDQYRAAGRHLTRNAMLSWVGSRRLDYPPLRAFDVRDLLEELLTRPIEVAANPHRDTEP